MHYRADIDGLRAIAVMSVVFFHLGLFPFTGGYIGVDVFFVISGFLITGIIKNELEKDEGFSFGRFYVRRMRRLGPALISTMFFSSCLAFLLFSPDLLVKAAESGLTALVSGSNFYFWENTDYFDIATNTKPFLHTWSLSVEEQFYFIWPLIAVLLFKYFGRKALPVFLSIVLISSFTFAQLTLARDPDGAFYLLPSRAGELAIGALVNWLGVNNTRKSIFWTIISCAALIAILGPIFIFSSATPFPGLMAVIPCIGTAVLLWSPKTTPVQRLLALRPLVQIGKMSYSIYLVHWPLIVFYFALTYRTLDLTEALGLALLSILLGGLQYIFIEQKFRFPTQPRQSFKNFSFKIVPIFIALAGIFTMGIYQQGLTWRVPKERLSLSNKAERNRESDKYCSLKDPNLPVEIVTCQNHRNKNKSIFVWGDSHARHLVAGLSETFPDHNVYVLYLSSCDPQSGFSGYVRGDDSSKKPAECVERNIKAMDFFKSKPGSLVVLTSAKRSGATKIANVTKAMLEELTQANVKAIWLGDFIRPGISLANCHSIPDYIISQKQNENRCVGVRSQIEKELAYNDEITKLVPEFVSPNSFQCPNGKCRFLDKVGLFYRDDHHLSIHGSKVLVNEIRHLLPF